MRAGRHAFYGTLCYVHMAELVDVAKRAARSGGDAALERFRTGATARTKDGISDLVTQADLTAQERIVETIKSTFPEHNMVGEESNRSGIVGDEHAWVIDPIDGTNNFVRDIRNWTTSVAFVANSVPKVAVNYLPALGDIYVCDSSGMRLNGSEVRVNTKSDPKTFTVVPTVWWDFNRRDEYICITKQILERFNDLQRLGSVQMVLSLLAAGSIEGVVTNLELPPWDSVAGVHMVRGAGGKVTDKFGDDWRFGCEGLVASNGQRHDEILAVIQ